MERKEIINEAIKALSLLESEAVKSVHRAQSYKGLQDAMRLAGFLNSLIRQVRGVASDPAYGEENNRGWENGK